ncbi:MAG: hypothetical protein ACPG6R_10910 [Aequoribacter sp.]|uniref:hypothetical protein n=1 Tax=Aequoribacter sp. TaxID=2847771 RepID=UPI003C3B46D4
MIYFVYAKSGDYPYDYSYTLLRAFTSSLAAENCRDQCQDHLDECAKVFLSKKKIKLPETDLHSMNMREFLENTYDELGDRFFVASVPSWFDGPDAVVLL